MSDVLTLPEVEEEIQRLWLRLEAETEKLAGLGVVAGKAEVEFKRAWAGAFLGAEDKTVDARKARADLATADLLFARRRAEVLYDACRETLRTIRTGLDSLRSINANARAQT